MRPVDVVLSLVVVVVWGVNFVALKIGVTHIPPIFLAALRFTAVAAMLLPFVPRPKRRDLPILFAIGFVFGGLHFATLFVGLTAADASVAAMVMQLGTPFSAIFAWVLLNDKFGWRRSVGLVIAFAGVALIVGFPSKETELWAVMCLLIAAAAWGLGNVLFKKADRLPFLAVMAWMSVCALVVLWPATLFFETGQWVDLTAAPADFLDCFWLYVGVFVGAGLRALVSSDYPVPRDGCCTFSIAGPRGRGNLGRDFVIRTLKYLSSRWRFDCFDGCGHHSNSLA